MAVVWLVYGLGLALYLGNRFGNWSWFSLHVAAMALSFVGLSAAAAVIRKTGGYKGTLRHGQIMGVASLLAAFGWYVIISQKNMLGKPHLTSWHSTWGIAALASYFGLFLVGLLGLHPDFGLLRFNKRLRAAHNLFGRVAIAFGWLACAVGFNNMDTDTTHRLLFAAPLAVGSLFVLL